MSDLASIGLDARGQPVVAGGDSRLWVKFSKRSRRNPFRSEQEGRPIFEPVDYITIQQPGERDQLVRPVREEDKHRFPRQWDAYVADSEQVPDGTPIAMLFPNEPHVVEILRDLKVLTVEQLAQLTEHGITRLGMDGRKYVARAIAAMDQSANAKQVSRLERELTDANDRMRTVEEANAALQARITALEALVSRRDDDEEEEERPRKRSRSRHPFTLPAEDRVHPPEPPRDNPLVDG
jgi:hypothetical protein